MGKGTGFFEDTGDFFEVGDRSELLNCKKYLVPPLVFPVPVARESCGLTRVPSEFCASIGKAFIGCRLPCLPSMVLLASIGFSEALLAYKAQKQA